MNIRKLLYSCVVLICGVLPNRYLLAQAAQTDLSNSLGRIDQLAKPSQDDYRDIINSLNALETATPDDAQKGLDAILLSLAGNGLKARSFASVGLMVISRRSDGAALLSPKGAAVVGHLADDDTNVARNVASVFNYADNSLTAAHREELDAHLQKSLNYPSTPLVFRSLFRLGALRESELGQLQKYVDDSGVALTSRIEAISYFNVGRMTEPRLAQLAERYMREDQPIEIRTAGLRSLRAFGKDAITRASGTVIAFSRDEKVPRAVRIEALHSLGGDDANRLARQLELQE